MTLFFRTMEKPAPSDPELLADWLGRHRESAFQALVARYAGLVHATAKRTCGDDSMAAEASQLTFIALAQKAKSLTSCGSLGGWLHLTAMMQAKNLIRKSQRENRKRQLLQATMETGQPHASNDIWQEMKPVLDEALASLSENDREALLLRFYRSLSIREIAETLGIATDAAQKRMDRAIDRLRRKLALRGVQAGGALSAALLAGFTADAQAGALPISILASKSIAAGAANAGTFTTITTLMTASKSSSIPLGILLAGLLGWVGTQRTSIAALEREVAALQTGFAEPESGIDPMTPTPKTSRTVKVFHEDQPIDWKEVADYFADPKRDSLWLTKLQEKLSMMSPEELIAEMDKIAALYPSDARMEQMVLRPLTEKDPELALRHLSGRLEGWTSSLSIPLIHAMQEWAKRDVAEATAWFDEQAAAGVFDGKQLNDRSLVDRFHGAIIGVMISRNRDAASLRFAMVPEKDRNSFLSMNMFHWAKEIHDYDAYASIIREMIPEKDRVWPIAAFAEAIAYEKVADYLDAINATPAERAASVGRAAEMRIQTLSGDEKITRSDIDAIREWAGKLAPHEVGKVTGIALARSTEINASLTFDEASKLALEYHAQTEDDDVLIGFLSSSPGHDNKSAARVIAKSIIDPQRREDLLRSLPIR